MQWVAGGAVAEAVIARNGEQIVLVRFPQSERKAEPNLASTAMAELRFAGAPRKPLAERCGRSSRVCAGDRGMEAVDGLRTGGVVATSDSAGRRLCA